MPAEELSIQKNVEKCCLYNAKSLEDIGKNHAFVMASE